MDILSGIIGAVTGTEEPMEMEGAFEPTFEESSVPNLEESFSTEPSETNIDFNFYAAPAPRPGRQPAGITVGGINLNQIGPTIKKVHSIGSSIHQAMKQKQKPRPPLPTSASYVQPQSAPQLSDMGYTSTPSVSYTIPHGQSTTTTTPSMSYMIPHGNPHGKSTTTTTVHHVPAYNPHTTTPSVSYTIPHGQSTTTTTPSVSYTIPHGNPHGKSTTTTTVHHVPPPVSYTIPHGQSTATTAPSGSYTVPHGQSTTTTVPSGSYTVPHGQSKTTTAPSGSYTVPHGQSKTTTVNQEPEPEPEYDLNTTAPSASDTIHGQSTTTTAHQEPEPEHDLNTTAPSVNYTTPHGQSTTTTVNHEPEPEYDLNATSPPASNTVHGQSTTTTVHREPEHEPHVTHQQSTSHVVSEKTATACPPLSTPYGLTHQLSTMSLSSASPPVSFTQPGKSVTVTTTTTTVPSRAATQPVVQPASIVMPPSGQIIMHPRAQVVFGRFPHQIQCPICHQKSFTNVRLTVHTYTIIMCVLLVLLFWPLCWLPFVMPDCKRADHVCGNCNRVVGSVLPCDG